MMPTFLTAAGVAALLCASTGCDKVSQTAVTETPAATGFDAPPTSATKPRSGLPAVETACKTNDDCTLFGLVIDGPEVCCPTCGNVAGSVAWSKKASAYCRENPGKSCSDFKCGMEPTVAVCEAGACVMKEKPAPPEVDRSCRSDADCTMTLLIAEGNQSCCRGCASMPVAKGWEASAEQFCKDHPNPDCVKHRCAVDEGKAVCNKGVCTRSE